MSIFSAILKWVADGKPVKANKEVVFATNLGGELKKSDEIEDQGIKNRFAKYGRQKTKASNGRLYGRNTRIEYYSMAAWRVPFTEDGMKGQIHFHCLCASHL